MRTICLTVQTKLVVIIIITNASQVFRLNVICPEKVLFNMVDTFFLSKKCRVLCTIEI